MLNSKTKEKITMSFDAYDMLIDNMSKVELHANTPFWPTVREIEHFKEILPTREMTYFLIWLTEMNGEAQNQSERESMSAMKAYLYEKLQLVDNKTENA